MTEDVLGYAVEARPLEACIRDIARHVRRDRGRAEGCVSLACLNPHSYAVAREDQRFAAALRDATWLVPDGIGVVIASRLCGGALRARITGSDVFFGLHTRLELTGGTRVFFLGATVETLALIRDRMARDFPNTRVVGTFSPPFSPTFSDDDLEQMLRAVNTSGADILWVGMTAPKQEKWIYENRARLDVKFVGAIGAVFDFYAGRVTRAHPVFQRLGLEWLPRLLREPRRVWRRTLISGPRFLWQVMLAYWRLRPLRSSGATE